MKYIMVELVDVGNGVVVDLALMDLPRLESRVQTGVHQLR